MVELLLFNESDGGSGTDDPMVKGGQIEFITPGSHIFTVPDGVTEVSVLIISAGQQGRAQASESVNAGRGGCLRWRNKLEVNAGETYQITVGNGGTVRYAPVGTGNSHQSDYASYAFGINVGVTKAETTPIGTNMGGGDSSGGGSGTNNYFKGGNAGTFTYDGLATPAGTGTDLNGAKSSSSNPYGGKYGGGGPAQASGSGTRTCGAGGNGAVKIIWGYGRAYPDKNIEDR